MVIPIRWGDMDALDHVNNAVTMRYFEEARVAWSQHHQLRNHRAEGGMIVAKATINYKRPLVYPGNIVSEILVARIGNSSFELHQKLTVESTGIVATTGDYVIVWYDYNNENSAPLPQRVRAILEGKAG